MEKFYPDRLQDLLTTQVKYFINERLFRRLTNFFLIIISSFFLQIIYPLKAVSQKLQMSFSYFNLTRNNGGGTLQQGDTIEIHALAQVNSTINNFYYIDTIPTGTQYISNSIKLVTNEGIAYTGSGPFTDSTNDDRGVFYSSANAVRVNIGTGYSNAQTGAPFAATAGGGTVVNGDIPKFYGNTLFIVAYKLLVTASNGDTIRPTGNYFFDTSGTVKSFHFTYPGIKVIQNLGLCNNSLGTSFSAESSFGTGNTQNRSTTATVPGYTKVNIGANAPQDNYFSIVNNSSANGTINNTGPFKPTTNNNRVFGGFWDIIGDHTGASNTATGNLPVASGGSGGYMLVVNAAYTTGEAYRDTIKNVCPNTYYEFSSWIRNICGYCGIDSNSNATYTPGVLPNLAYSINDIDYYTTGNIKHDSIWEKHGFLYLTGPTETQFRITIRNNAAGGGGNDWVLDDIDLATCYPTLINNPDTASSCVGVPLTLRDTVKSYFNNYTYYCWQKSTNGTSWTSTGVCGAKVPVLVNGEWSYVVDTTFTPTAADSGTYYRILVATTSANLTNSSCAIGNNQKIFLRIFNTHCSTLDATLLSFGGNVFNDRGSLRWTSQGQENLKTYTIERSTDGINFSQAGMVAAINDMNGADYSFIDPEPITSIAYYRLKLVSTLDNNAKYSKIIILYNKNAIVKINPVNPFRSNLKINMFLPEDGQADFYLYDLLGKCVIRKSMQLTKGNTKVLLNDLENIYPGMYILRTKFNNTIVETKLFKVD